VALEVTEPAPLLDTCLPIVPLDPGAAPGLAVLRGELDAVPDEPVVWPEPGAVPDEPVVLPEPGAVPDEPVV
jgi:hypothetical protein